MISIPVPEGFQMEGREDGSPFEMTVTGHIEDGQIVVDEVEGIAVVSADEPEEAEVEMDEGALAMAMGGPPA